MNIHFIAIGGAAMHNIAIALYKKGYTVTGSDDEIFDPSKSRLEKYGLLPPEWGWFPEKIKPETDAVILGMHALKDNPELLKAQEIGVRIYSFPEYLFEQTKHKKRIVIGGSHGKTTITSMIMHVLKTFDLPCDYLVGSNVEGYETMAGLSENTEIAIFEGDEYLSSHIDRRPKFHLYQPHVAVISGIAWDHINVFPTFENYLNQFRVFAKIIPKGGSIIYFSEDPHVKKIVDKIPDDLKKVPYKTHPYEVSKNKCYLITKSGKILLIIFGEHNLQNLNAARFVCKEIGLSSDQFYEAIKSFSGAQKRLQLLDRKENTSIYLDFAHAPSKLKATVKAVKDLYPERTLVACMELHTFSSLQEKFLSEYKNSMKDADLAYVYFDPKAIEHKKLDPLSIDQVTSEFGGNNLIVFNNIGALLSVLEKTNWSNKNLLIMSSGNFSGINFKDFAAKILGRK